MKPELPTRFFTAVLLAAAGLAALLWFLVPLAPAIPPDAVDRLTSAARAYAAPEPQEMFFFCIACIGAIPVSLAAWSLAGAMSRAGCRLCTAVAVSGLLAGCLAPDGWMRMFHPLPWYVMAGAAMAAGALALCPPDRVRRAPGRLKVCTWIAFAFLLLMILCCRIHAPARMDDNFDDHICIVLYALNAACHGLAEIHLYGFYPAMLAPVFRLTGTSMLTVSLVMNLLYIAAFLLILDVMRHLLHSRICFLLSGFALALICGNGYFFERFGWMRIDPYFAYWPVRFLWPAAAVWSVYRVKRHLPFWSGLIAGTALWWNPDSGLAAAGAYGIFFLLTSPLRTVGIYTAVLSVVLLLWAGLLTLILGAVPDLAGYFSYMLDFSRAGYYLMPLAGGWTFGWSMAGILLAALLAGMLFKQSFSGSRMLFCSVLGIGLGTYYIGRSHPANLGNVSWMVFFLLTLWCDRILTLTRCRRLPAYWLLTAAPLFLFGAASLILPFRQIRQTVLGLQYTMASFSVPSRTDAEIGAVLRLAGPDRTVNILPGKLQGIFYGETGLKPGTGNFSASELLMQKDVDRAVRELKSSAFPLLVTGGALIPPELAPYYVLTAELPEYGVRRYMPISGKEKTGNKR